MSVMLESQTLPNIEGKLMEFTLDILDAQFNHEGYYYLTITLTSSFSNNVSQQVKVMKGDSGVWEKIHQMKTDFTKQEESTLLSFFKDKKFTIRFPKGFFKNDNNHDVYLLVEAFSAQNSTIAKPRKVGEGKFPIYPRPNAPRMKLYAEPGEDYYNYSDVMSLLRTHDTDNMKMHCGRIRSNYSIREVVPLKPKSPPPPPRAAKKIKEEKSSKEDMSSKLKPVDTNIKQPVVVPPTPASSWGDNLSLELNLPKSPPLPPATDGKKLPESPLTDSDRHTFSTDKSYCHVSNVGLEQIEVIFHGASSLPLTADGQVPQPYAVIKTKKDEDSGKKSKAVTHASMRPTHVPCWEEMVTLGIDEKTSADEVLVVSVGDGLSKKGLVNYRIPVTHLTPFHQYHLELNMPISGIPSGIKTFATITRKLPRLPRDPSSPNYLALEVLLMSVQKPIKEPMGPLIAVARIVPDYYNYRSDILESHPRNAGIVMQNVTFPSAHPTNFAVTERSFHGHPQLTLPGRPDVQPSWNHPYLFVEERDKATLFTPGAALVIEYYVASTAMTDHFWRMQSPVAFSAILMDEEMYKHLISDRAKNGLRVDGIPVQGSGTSSIDGTRPTVGAILRLITTETPDSMVSLSNPEDIPSLDLFPPGYMPGYSHPDSPDVLLVSAPPAATHLQGQKPKPESPLSPPHTPGTPPMVLYGNGSKKTSENAGKYVLQRVRKRPLSPIKDGEMPPFHAMESALPEYQYVFMPVDDQGHRTPTRAAPPISNTIKNPADLDKELDKNSLVLLDYQNKELGSYHDAVHKMSQDILSLRNQVRELEGNNSMLRRDLANYNDASRLMIDSAELDGLTKPDVLSRYAALKRTLSMQTADLKAYKDKLQKVQNELIQKNDKEKEFLKIKKSYTSQQNLMKKLQDRFKMMKQLEEACKKQENVIIQMEKVLEKHHRDRSKYQKDKASQDANEVLLQENKRLREQIEQLRIQVRIGGSSDKDDLEKMELYQALEKAEGRIAALENQLAQNSRMWGKERADLSLKLNEAEHGFGRSAGMVLHDYPVFNDITQSKTSLRALSPVYR